MNVGVGSWIERRARIAPDRAALVTVEGRRTYAEFGNPDLLEALARAEHWPHADLSSIRFILTGGAPVPDRLLRTYLDRGVTLLQGYGLSEAGPLALLLDAASAQRKVGSAGRPPLLVDVRVVDEVGRDAAIGETGELHVRGPNVMVGYWHRPEDTADVLTDGGWLRTGDAARHDDEGFVCETSCAPLRATRRSACGPLRRPSGPMRTRTA